MPHLFADISAHGLGHLAQSAPVLNRLGELLPDLRLTLRSALSADRLRQRLRIPFEHLAGAGDFGFVMHDALRIDLPATAAAYRSAHAGFPMRVAREAEMLKQLGVDAVCANVAYLPLAGAAWAGLPAVALCSLNWADLYAHYFGADAIHAEMLAAYRSAAFLRVTPGMPMPELANQRDIGPIAEHGRDRRAELAQKVSPGGTATRVVMIALGGIPTRLPVERWPVLADTHWLVPAAWRPARDDFHAIEDFDWPFVDLLRSVDAIVAKPGYGTFAEAVRNGAAVIYQKRDDWPEQDCLVEWLHAHGRCAEIGADDLAAGRLEPALASCRQAAVPPALTFDGAEAAARFIANLLA
ncbi:MAG: hypothetical protein AB1642_06715 [Pseudomonadota bacterium]